MTTSLLPNSIVLNVPTAATNPYVYCKDDKSVGSGSDSVFNTVVKITVEQATANSKYVHLRFTYNNKYWQKNTDDNSIVAVSSQKVEDTTDPSCTLFEPNLQSNAVVSFTHVQTGWPVVMNNSTSSLYVDESGSATALGFVDGNTLVQLPTNIALKGDNGMWLHAYQPDGWFLRFQSNDPNNDTSGHTVTLMPDGHVRILCNYYDRFWYTNVNDQWVYSNWDDSTADETASFFWPVKIDDTTIVLRSAANNNFCKRLTTDATMVECLAASIDTIASEARMQVQERVSQRKIYGVAYNMEDAMILNETPYVAGTSTLTNSNDEEASMEVSITYQNEISYTFSRGTSISAGVDITIEAGIPLIEETTIEMSFSIDSTLQWDTTVTTTTSVTATGTVPVPANSTVTVAYVGTQGTCNIPYTYTQEDVSSTTGEITYYSQTDGIYNGVSCYNFNFQILQPQSAAA